MATNHKPTAKAEANVPSKRTVKVVSLQELSDAVRERREGVLEFQHLLIQFDHFVREAKVCGEPEQYAKAVAENAKARKRAKARVKKASTVIARYEKARAKRLASA